MHVEVHCSDSGCGGRLASTCVMHVDVHCSDSGCGGHTTFLPFPAEAFPLSPCGVFVLCCVYRGRYHAGRRPSSDDSFHSPTVIPPSSLDKPSIMKRSHRRGTCIHTSLHRSPTMVTLHDTRFVECRWWNDGWIVKTVVT